MGKELRGHGDVRWYGRSAHLILSDLARCQWKSAASAHCCADWTGMGAALAPGSQPLLPAACRVRK